MSPTSEQPEAAEQSADELTAAPEGEHRIGPDDPDATAGITADPAEANPDWDPARATEPPEPSVR